MEIQVITNRCFGLFMRRNVCISRNRTKIERLLDWKEFPSKSVGRFSFQCLPDIQAGIRIETVETWYFQIWVNFGGMALMSSTKPSFI